MILSLKFRERLAAMGQFLVGEFDNLVASIRAAWDAQHQDDGSHGDITALSLKVIPLVTFRKGAIEAAGELQIFPKLALTGKEFYQNFSDTQGIAFLLGVNRTGNRQLWIADTAKLDPNTTNPMFRVGLIGSAVSLDALATNGITPLTLNIQNSQGPTVFGGSISEFGRSSAMGAWLTPTFAATDFTGNGTMTWVVIAGNVTTCAYTLIGKTMLFVMRVLATTVGGVANTTLSFKIPGGFVAAKTMDGVFYTNQNGVESLGRSFVQAGLTAINFVLVPAANWTLGAVTSVRVSMQFEIQ